MGNTELYVQRLLQSLSICHSSQLNIETISRKSNIKVRYWEYSSESVHWKGNKVIFLNENLTDKQQWQEFGHELCHTLWHAGRQEQISESLCKYQEWQADHFMYHLCIPTFMIMKLKEVTAHDVMDLFNVEFNFALRRLDMLQSKTIERVAENARTYS